MEKVLQSVTITRPKNQIESERETRPQPPFAKGWVDVCAVQAQYLDR